MNANEPVDHIVGGYRRWLARRPVLRHTATTALGCVILAVGVFVLHSRPVVFVAMVSLTLSLGALAGRLSGRG